MNKRANRIVSVLLSLLMCLNTSFLPVMAEGEDVPVSTEEPVEEVIQEEEPGSEDNAGEEPETTEEPGKEAEPEITAEPEPAEETPTPEAPSETEERGIQPVEIETPVEDEVLPDSETVEDDAEMMATDPKYFTTTIRVDGSVEISGYTGTDSKVMIPMNIDGRSVTSIGANAFSDNYRIKEVLIPYSVDTIDNCAFWHCYNLEHVDIPYTVNRIGSSAFNSCKNLTSIALPQSLQKLETCVFMGCEKLTSVDIPDRVNTIESSAFSGCKNLRSVTIPNSIRAIENYTFADCENLQTINIPSRISEFGDGAFSGCRKLTSITIPRGVESIGERAFAGSGITEVFLPSRLLWLGNYAFSGCSNLTSISLPTNLRTIPSGLLQRCSSLRTIDIPNGVTTIEDSAFSSCSMLESVFIPYTVTLIENYAFSGAYNLAAVYYNGDAWDWKHRVSVGSYNEPLKNAAIISNEVRRVIDLINNIGTVTLESENAIRLARSGYNQLSNTLRSYVINYQTLENAEYTFSRLQIKNVSNLIDAIGEVTLESVPEITSARKAYENLSDTQKSEVTNYAVLEQAEQKLSELQVENVINLINSIGEVKLESESQISAARTAYDQLSDEQKTKVTNYDVLTKAEETLSELQIENVINKIEELENVTLDDLDKVQEARSLYDGLTSDQQALVTNYSKLQEAETVISELQIQKVETLIDSLPDTVALDDKGSVESVRAEYDALSEEQKTEVENYEKLVAAETQIIKLEEDKAAAEIVINAINSIGEVTLDSERVINEVRGKYNELTDDQKALITNYSVLTEAEQTYSNLRVQEVISLIEGLPENITVSDKSQVETVREAYEKLNEDQKAEVTNYDVLTEAEEAIAIQEEIIAWGEIAEEDKDLFPNYHEIPSGLWTAGIPEQVTYDGSKKVFKFRLYDGNILLKEKKDYTVSYKNNKNAGTATVTLKMKGNYTGTRIINFNIKKDSLNEDNADITVDPVSVQATGKVLKPVPVVYFNGKKLKNKTDYIVDYGTTEIKDAGTYEITVNGNGNFEGSRTVTVKVAGTGQKPVSKLKVTAKSIPYSSLAEQDTVELLKDYVSVLDGKTPLEYGTDYVFDAPEGMDHIGTYTVVLKGMAEGEAEGYVGERNVTVKVTGTNLADKKLVGTVTGEYVFEPGCEYEPKEFTWKYNKKETVLTEGADYNIIRYENNDKAGTAKIILEGKGEYYGTKTLTFKIQPKKDITVDDVQVAPAYYAKGGAKPEVTIENLTLGTDYTVKYGKNNKVGVETGSVTITFKGNYKGNAKLTKKFDIKTKDFNEVTITAKDLVVSTKAGKYKSTPVLKDTDGKTLKAGTDYEKVIEYEEVTEDGTMIRTLGAKDTVSENSYVRVTVTGRNNFTNEKISVIYRILDTGMDISKYTITVKAQEYTGKAIELKPQDITFKVNKKVLELNPETDYEIVSSSYTNNIKKGSATVTIRGKGEYGGTKTVKFKIAQRNINNWWSGLFEMLGI